MPETSDQWSEFTNEHGTIVRCLIEGDYLELVTLVSPEGWSLDVEPAYVDHDMIEKGLNRPVKLH